MKLDKNRFNLLLAKWIKWDGDLWAELRDVQIKLLFDRIVKEMTCAELAKTYQSTPAKIREILSAIFFKLEQSHGKELGDLIKQIDAHIEGGGGQGLKEKPEHGFDFEKVFLN